MDNILCISYGAELATESPCERKLCISAVYRYLSWHWALN